MPNTQPTRRRFLTIAGSGALVGVSGCLSDANESPEEGVEDNPGETPTDDPEEESESDTEWADVDEFYFEGRIEAWTGIEPAMIEGEDNPTVVLFEGEEYDFRWVNEDGAIHNLEIRDENDEVIDEYATDYLDIEGEEEALENVVASLEMATYVCVFHQETQVGNIEVRSL